VPNDRLLAIYLNDHLAGSAIARDRCRHARDKNSGTEVGAFLDRLLREIDEDQATLRRVMAAVGVKESPLKVALGHLAERAARLKPNGDVRTYTPLSRLVELEALSLGVEGKRLLWVALGELDDPRLAAFDFAALVARAQDQRDGLERHRLEAARAAFAWQG
jgi:hypothetical protein